MADEPSIDEILASLDSLLEDAGIGNDEPQLAAGKTRGQARDSDHGAPVDGKQERPVKTPPDTPPPDAPELRLTPPAPPPQIELTAEQLLEEDAPAAPSGDVPDAAVADAAHNAPPAPAGGRQEDDAASAAFVGEVADEVADEVIGQVRAALKARLPALLAPVVSEVVAGVVRESVDAALARALRGPHAAGKDGDEENGK